MTFPDHREPQAYSSEAMSPQKRASWKKRFSKLARVQLMELQGEIENLLEDGDFDTEFEVASKHYDPRMVHRTFKDQGRHKLQEIYCCEARCSHCPHGPFWFVYRSSRQQGIKVRFQGTPALPPELIDEMNDETRPPVACAEIETGRFSN